MAPAIKRTGRINLQGSLDRDVYQVLKKLEDSINDGRQFKSVYQAYEAVKKSNSSLSRQKKRPLEDSIDRVLQFRKQEEQDSDSDAAIEKEEATETPAPVEDARFLLNRQMVANWSTNKTSTDDEPRAAKKRRVDRENNDVADDGSGEAKTSKRSHSRLEESATEKPRKSQRHPRFEVEQSYEPILLGGMAHVSRQLTDEIGGIIRFHERFANSSCGNVPGFVISGPPGSGKKSLVRNVALTLKLPLVSIAACIDDPERIEKSLNEAFDEAARLGPSILFLEDLDQYMPKPDGNGHNEHQRRAVRLFSKHMQKLAKVQPADRHVLALSTTSHLAGVDPLALKRGLFSRTIHIKVPDLPMRKDMFRVVLGTTPVDDSVNLEDLAKMTHGYVGADIADLVQTALTCATTRDHIAWRASSHPNGAEVDMGIESQESRSTSLVEVVPDRDPLTWDDFTEAIKNFTPTLRKEGFTDIPNITWESVGALQEVRKQLNLSIIGPIKNPDLYQRFGLTSPAGVLLWGPPGCGKTLVAQAVASAAQASFILINGPELLNKYVGESERAVRELFQRARSSTPCILFFDEIDSLVPRRDNASTEAGARVVNALLTELDGAQDRKGIYVIGTTNRPDMIDRAILRPGRLSSHLFVDLPTPPERVDILKAVYRTAHASRSFTSVELDQLDRVAGDERCTDFSGADLAALHIKAATRALENYLNNSEGGEERIGEERISEQDWEWALANTTRSVLNPEMYRKLNTKLGKAG